MRRLFAVLLLFGLAAGASGPEAMAAALPWQHLPEGRQAVVAAVPGGDRLTLDDGTEVALVSLRAPRVAGGQPPEPGLAEAQATLAGLALRRSIRLYGPADARDRHGRYLAHAVTIGAADRPDAWLQAEMIGRGMARASPLAGEHPALAAALLALEADARTAGTGLWQEPAYAIRSAPAPAGIPLGYQLVEGRVLAVGESASSLFLNFGADWRHDFTVVVERRDREGFPQGLRSVREMQGRLVRVRGAVFQYGGPAIRIRHANAIEILEEER